MSERETGFARQNLDGSRDLLHWFQTERL